ncbi:hypothetical protein G4B88_008226, partial [Cannabis sativa]
MSKQDGLPEMKSMVSMSCECHQKLLSSLILFTHIALIALICFLIHSYCCSVPIPYISIAITFCEPLTELNWNMAELVIGAVISSSLDFLLKRVASPYFKEFFKENESFFVSERLFKLKSTLNCLAAARFEVENKRIKNPAVEKWLEDLLDAVDDAENFFGDIEYNAMKPNKPDELKKAKRMAIHKLLSRFSEPSNSADHKRNTNMVEILKRLEYLANQIGYLNLEKNVVDVKPSERLCAKTSLPDEPEIYGTSYFVMHDLIVDLARIVSGKYSCLLEHNEDIIASPYVKDFFFKRKNESSSVVSERLFKLKSTFNSLAAVRFEVENKRIKNPAVEKWLDNLLDAIDDVEDFFGDIEYNAMKPNKAYESRKARRKASKLFSCFSNPSDSTDRVRNANMEEILKRLEYLANQIGNLNLEKNVVEVKPSEGSRAKTSLPDEPEIYEHNGDIVRFEKKTRHLGCVTELYRDNKVSSLDFEITRLHNRENGWKCYNQKQPLTAFSHPHVPQQLLVLQGVLKRMRFPVYLQDVTTLSAFRRDGHPSVYRRAMGQEEKQHLKNFSSDCSHWCLPGVPDIWNEMLIYHYPPLQVLRLWNCGSSFRSLHMDLFPNLKTLRIQSSHYFEALSMSNVKSLEQLSSLFIEHCSSFVSFPNGGLLAPKLSEFIIRDCPKLKWLPEKMTSLSSLESLTIKDCPLIEPFPKGEGE